MQIEERRLTRSKRNNTGKVLCLIYTLKKTFVNKGTFDPVVLGTNYQHICTIHKLQGNDKKVLISISTSL